MVFIDRADAGRWLAARLERLRIKDPVVLAVPRGGVFVGYEIARVLDAPLDVIVPASSRRARLYRRGQPPVPIAGKTVVLVDDGLESPATLTAACAAVRKARPAHVVFATPVCLPAICGTLKREGVEVVAHNCPEDIGQPHDWYAHVPRPTEAEVTERLDAARAERQAVLWL